METIPIISKSKSNIIKIIKTFGVVLLVLIIIIIISILMSNKGDNYNGGYSPTGDYCDYGYNSDTKDCCDEDDYSCEERDRGPKGGCTIKGNIGSSGEKIYHVSDCGSYEKTTIDKSKGEKLFCSEQDALDAGWRKALNCN